MKKMIKAKAEKSSGTSKALRRLILTHHPLSCRSKTAASKKPHSNLAA